MQFVVTMKDPDTLDDAVRAAVRHDLERLSLPVDEVDSLVELRASKVRDLCSKWFEHGEYLSVRIDTEAKTCTVLEGER